MLPQTKQVPQGDPEADHLACMASTLCLTLRSLFLGTMPNQYSRIQQHGDCSRLSAASCDDSSEGSWLCLPSFFGNVTIASAAGYMRDLQLVCITILPYYAARGRDRNLP